MYKIGDEVKLPFSETGTIVNILDILWGFKYIVRIRKSTLNKTNNRVEYKEEQLSLEN